MRECPQVFRNMAAQMYVAKLLKKQIYRHDPDTRTTIFNANNSGEYFGTLPASCGRGGTANTAVFKTAAPDRACGFDSHRRHVESEYRMARPSLQGRWPL